MTIEIPVTSDEWPEGHTVYIRPGLNIGQVKEARAYARRQVLEEFGALEPSPALAALVLESQGEAFSAAFMAAYILRVEGDQFCNDNGKQLVFDGSITDRASACSYLPTWAQGPIGEAIGERVSNPLAPTPGEKPGRSKLKSSSPRTPRTPHPAPEPGS